MRLILNSVNAVAKSSRFNPYSRRMHALLFSTRWRLLLQYIPNSPDSLHATLHCCPFSLANIDSNMPCTTGVRHGALATRGQSAAVLPCAGNGGAEHISHAQRGAGPVLPLPLPRGRARNHSGAPLKVCNISMRLSFDKAALYIVVSSVHRKSLLSYSKPSHLM